MSVTLPLALLALVPAMIGPLPAPAPAPDGGGTITARLCNGGTITIPLGDDDPGDGGHCHPKGCHAGSCRERPKRTI